MGYASSIELIYSQFAEVFPRPTSFYNEYCCVTAEHERPLLALPLRELTEEMLAMPIDHYGSCFGTFEQVSYFVPRLMELLVNSRQGFEYGVLYFSFFRLLQNNECRYRRLGLWDAIEKALNELFTSHTSTPPDIRTQDLTDQLLEGFFCPVLSDRKRTLDADLSAWDEFVLEWAEDECPQRVCHLLDLVRQHCIRHISGYDLPDVFLECLRRESYQSALVKRAAPAFASLPSRWLEETGDCLNKLLEH